MILRDRRFHQDSFAVRAVLGDEAVTELPMIVDGFGIALVLNAVELDVDVDENARLTIPSNFNLPQGVSHELCRRPHHDFG